MPATQHLSAKKVAGEYTVAAIIHAPSPKVAADWMAKVVKMSGIEIDMKHVGSYQLVYKGNETETERNSVRNAVNNLRDELHKMGGNVIDIFWQN